MSAVETTHMKKLAAFSTRWIVLILACASFSSCLKDRCTRHFKIYTPVTEKLSNLRASVKSMPAQSMQQPGKLFIKGNLIFLNELNKGIHVIDNSNPARPVKKSFIAVPGNIDFYSSGNFLYADLYCDLAALDISNPSNVSVSKFLTKTFPGRVPYSASQNPDSIDVITAWLGRDTVADCSAPVLQNIDCPNCNGGFYTGATASTPTKSAAGSQARFAAVDNYLYTVTSNTLNVVDITERNNPVFAGSTGIGWGIETIFPYGNRLYIGAGSSMSVMDIQDPLHPAMLSWTGHWCSNDPVIVDGHYAYVTLHEADVCGSRINQLEIYDLSNDLSPRLVNTYPMKFPKGLSKDGNLLFVCDDGLKVYDATSAGQLVLKKQIPAGDAFDVIAQNGIAMVTSKQGLYQFSYSDPANIHQVSLLKY